MARRLGRSPSSISAELKRNQVDGVYGSTKAHQAAEARKRHSLQKYLLPHRSVLRDFVLEKLKLGWSPQQISGRLKKEISEGVRPKREYINHESIYQFLYDPEQQEEKLWAYLPRRHRQRRRWLGRRSRSVQIPNRVSIRHRPAEIGNREEFAHWEGDTMVGEGHRTGIHTEVERISRLVFAYKVSKIRAKETSAVQIFLFSRLPKLARRSTTLDKGVGFIAAASVRHHHPRIVCWHHLLDFLVAVPGPDLVDRDLISVEGHQVGVLSTYPPASIISVYRWRFPYRAA